MTLTENDSRCPWCAKVNPPIRRVPAFASPGGLTVIYSCGHCKRIISIETISNEVMDAPVPQQPEKEAA